MNRTNKRTGTVNLYTEASKSTGIHYLCCADSLIRVRGQQIEEAVAPEATPTDEPNLVSATAPPAEPKFDPAAAAQPNPAALVGEPAATGMTRTVDDKKNVILGVLRIRPLLIT